MAGLGATAPATPAYDAGATTCSGVYCHGATLGGGPAATPAWASTDALGCTSCHGAPPPPPHTTGTACGRCHAGYAPSAVTAATHLNGAVEAEGGHPAGFADPAQHGSAARAGLASCLGCHGPDAGGGTVGVSCNACHGGTAWQTDCTFCHGTAPSGPASPPVDTQGRFATSNVSVGAHAAHVATTLTATPVACTECHPSRAGSNVLTDAEHVDGDARAEVVFGGRAGASAAYTRASDTSATCASTYCHGAATVEWTSTAALGCASCHGAPPAAPHTASTNCGACHEGYTISTVSASTHLDGRVQSSSPHPLGYADRIQHGYEVNRSGLATCKTCHGPSLASCDACHGGAAWRTSCTFCHGTSPSGPASPPVDTQGGTAATNVSVGVHASHVATTIATPIACVQCHPDRSGSNVTTDTAHVDGNGIAEVVFAIGSLARTGGAAPAYTRLSATSATCASTYCHGRFTGGSAATVNWTSTTAATCTSCHAMPSSAAIHTRGAHASYSCSTCHFTVVSSSNAIIAPALHVNGADDIGFSNGGTWTPSSSPSTSNCSASTCH
jgi:predicted CxxxxCH...CXXCH cytochrome family protein